MRSGILVLLLFSFGCSSGSVNYKDASTSREVVSPSSVPPSTIDESSGWEGEQFVSNEQAPQEQNSQSPSQTDQDSNSNNRKIIYSASMNVVVQQFDDFDRRIAALVLSFEGFISSANIGRMQGESRTGSWCLRIPVENYHSFLDSVGDIGTVASRNEVASDVTAEFYDLEARITNKQKLEARIIELLENPDGKIQQVIEVERELSRVREEIERMQGRKRYLTDVTSLTTVNLTVQEVVDYIPPQKATFASRIRIQWDAAVVQATQIFEWCILAIVRNAIGFAAIVVGLLLGIPLLRLLLPIVGRIWHFIFGNRLATSTNANR